MLIAKKKKIPCWDDGHLKGDNDCLVHDYGEYDRD